MEVWVSYYRDKEEHIRKEENCNTLGENLGLAGVVLLLNRSDKRDSCSFVT